MPLTPFHFGPTGIIGLLFKRYFGIISYLEIYFYRFDFFIIYNLLSNLFHNQKEKSILEIVHTTL